MATYYTVPMLYSSNSSAATWNMPITVQPAAPVRPTAKAPAALTDRAWLDAQVTEICEFAA